MFITLDIASIDVGGAGVHSFIAFCLMAVNLIFYYIDKRYTFLIFTILHATWLFFSLTNFLVGGRPFGDWEFIQYRWLMVGISYLSLGYYYTDTNKDQITQALYTVGVVAFLAASFFLGGFSPNQNIFWELAFPGICFGALFLSVYLKRKSFLITGTISLMVYIMKITGEYFTSGFGWALSLIIVGFSLIGLGYLAVHINKKYISA